MHWVKKVKMTDSVDYLLFSSPVKGIQMSNFKVLDAKIASILNKIIHNFFFQKRVSLVNKWPKSRTVFFAENYLPHLWVLPGHWSQRFCRELRRPIHHWSSKWRYSGIRFYVGRNFVVHDEIPHGEILEGLYKLRLRASQKIKTVFELYYMQILQKKLKSDLSKLKSMVKKFRVTKKMSKRNDSKTRVPYRMRQKKYPKIEWSFRVSTKENSSFFSRRRTILTRWTTLSWIIIGTKIGIFVKNQLKSSIRWKNWSDFKGPHSMKIREEYWSRTETLSLNLKQRFRNDKMTLIVWLIERFSRCWISMQWKFPRYESTSVIPTSSNTWRNTQPFYRNAEPQRRGASIWDTHGLSETFFANRVASSSAPYQQEKCVLSEHDDNTKKQ